MRRVPALLPVSLLLCLWLVALYWARFALMEEATWLERCLAQPEQLTCQARAALGLIVHWRLLAWLALAGALVASLIRRPLGSWLAMFSLFCGVAALVLYSASLAAFGGTGRLAAGAASGSRGRLLRPGAVTIRRPTNAAPQRHDQQRGSPCPGQRLLVVQPFLQQLRCDAGGDQGGQQA